MYMLFTRHVKNDPDDWVLIGESAFLTELQQMRTDNLEEDAGSGNWDYRIVQVVG
jgi:hypothetical protein